MSVAWQVIAALVSSMHSRRNAAPEALPCKRALHIHHTGQNRSPRGPPQQQFSAPTNVINPATWVRGLLYVVVSAASGPARMRGPLLSF